MIMMGLGVITVFAGVIVRDVYKNWDYFSVSTAIEEKNTSELEKYLTANVEDIARFENKLLRMAVQKDFVHAVKLLLGYEAVSDSLKNDNSCLFLAMEYGYEDIVLEMVRHSGIKDSLKLDKKVWEKIFSIEKVTPIMVAAILETEENDVTSKISERDYQLVMLAAKAGRFDILTLFLDYAGIKDAVIANYAEAILEASTEGKNEGVVLCITKMLIQRIDCKLLLEMAMNLKSGIVVKSLLQHPQFQNILVEHDSQLLQQYITDCYENKVETLQRNWDLERYCYQQHQDSLSRQVLDSSTYKFKNYSGMNSDDDSSDEDGYDDYVMSTKHYEHIKKSAFKLRPAVKDVIHECLKCPGVIESILANASMFALPHAVASMPELEEIRDIAFRSR